MSFLLSFKAAKCTLGNSSVKAVFRCLCDYANDDGSNCRPSTETIALETECDRRTVFKAVSFLATNGWIKVFSKGRGARNFYAINVEKIEAVYQQSKGAAEQIKFESGDKNVTTSGSNNTTSGKNDTSNKNAPRVVSILSESGDKNVTTSGSNNTTSGKNDTSNKNAPRVVSILSESGDKNVTQLSQTQSIQSDKPIERAPNFSLTAPKKTTISKTETVAKKERKPRSPYPFSENDPIPEEFLKIAQANNIQDPQELFKKMVLWCQANGRPYKNWKAGFTTWCLREVGYQKEKEQKKQTQASKQNQFSYEPPGGFTDDYYRDQCEFDENGNLKL